MSIAELFLMGSIMYVLLSAVLYVSFDDLIATLFASFFTLPVSFAVALLIYLGDNQQEKEMELVAERLNIDQSEIILEDGQFYTSEGTYKVIFAHNELSINFDEYAIEKIVKTGEIMELTE